MLWVVLVTKVATILRFTITPTTRAVQKQRYTLQKQKFGHYFIYLEDYVIQRRMNKQSGFDTEQVEKDKYPESKTI
jgi:hypothetical protein